MSVRTLISQRKREVVALYLPLWLCLMIALIVRAVLIIRSGGMIDGDEALVGIQAEHILHGERPIYFYGQPYMGSLEAYLVALLFALVGPSVWALRAEPVLLSLLLVWLTWRLAAALMDGSALPTDTRRFFQVVATVIAALAPLYDTVLELRTLGGYIEVFILMLLLLLLVLRLTQSWSRKSTLREQLGYWAGIGGVLGLGFWVNPLIVSACVCAALWFVGSCLLTFNGLPSLLLRIAAIGAALPTFLIGSAPALFWGVSHQWQNVLYLLNRGGSTQSGTVLNLMGVYASCAAPRVIGGALPMESSALLALHAFPLILGLCCLGTCIVLVGLSFVRRSPLLRQARILAALPLLFAGCAAIFFCIGSGPSLCPSDMLGRYAVPLVLVLPFFYAICFVCLHLSFQRSDRLPRWFSPRIGERLVLVLFLLSLCAQAATYELADSGRIFQSPSCLSAPANDGSIINYMQQEHIHYAWAITWIGNPIIFKSNGALILADPRPLMAHSSDLGRIPAYVETLQRVDRPSMLVFITHNDSHPYALSILDSLHVTYHTKVFPSQPGIDILLITPLNRTVSPLETNAFRSVFVPCKLG